MVRFQLLTVPRYANQILDRNATIFTKNLITIKMTKATTYEKAAKDQFRFLDVYVKRVYTVESKCFLLTLM